MWIWENHKRKKAQGVARLGLTLGSDSHRLELPVLQSEEVRSGTGRIESHDLVARLRQMLDYPLTVPRPNHSRPSGSAGSAQAL